jgi:uncharacterized membrane protein (UPF0127 family)
MKKVTLLNRTRGTVLGTAIEVADSGGTRKKGLLGRTRLENGAGLWIIPTEAVHTFFMKFSIDLVYLDRKKRVTKVAHRVKPWRMSGSWRGYSVVELPAGVAEEAQTEKGDQIEVQEPDPPTDSG